MNERERATDTFRSISREAVNNILDELDKIGDFARLNAHLVNKADVQEVFKAINSYSKEIEAKYEPKVDSRNWRFQFSDEKFKVHYEKEVESIKPETVLTLARKSEEENKEVEPLSSEAISTLVLKSLEEENKNEEEKRYEIVLPDGTKTFADNLTEVAKIVKGPYSQVCRRMKGKKVCCMYGCIVVDRLPNSPLKKTARREIEIYVDDELLATCQHGYREASNVTHIPTARIREHLSSSDDGTYIDGAYMFKYGKEIV